MLNDHDLHHYHDYRNWAENAKANRRAEAGVTVKKGVALRFNWWY
jgi:hypothetical protein